MLDIFFLSYDEPQANKRWKEFSDRFSHARRICNIKGIHTAHIKCAEQSNTESFYVVDADTEVLEFDFSFIPDEWSMHYTHIWHSRNVMNGLEYGYGGIKLFNRSKVLRMPKHEMPVDFSQSVAEVKIMKEVASITRFNTSPFHTWRSAVRECAKLVSNTDNESWERLKIWMNECDKNERYMEQYFNGGHVGMEIGLPFKHIPNKEMLAAHINNFDWLKEQYESLDNESENQIEITSKD